MVTTISPFLRLLLTKKRPNDIPYDDPNDPIPEQPIEESRIAGPTISLRPRPSGMFPADPNAPPIDPGFSPQPSPFPEQNRDPGFTPRPQTTAQGGLSQPLMQQPMIPITRPRTIQPVNAPQSPMIDATQDDSSRREKIINAMQKSVNLSPEGSDARGAINSVMDGDNRTPTISLRPRRVSVDTAASEPPLYKGQPILAERFGSDNEPFGARPRRTQPRDYVADDAAYLRELENKPRSKTKQIFEGIGQVAASGVGIDLSRLLHRRGTDVERARERVATDLAVEGEQAQTRNANATAYEKLGRAPSGSTRIVDEGEYSNIPAGTEIRQAWNGQEMVDAVGQNGKPVVSKASPTEKAAAREIKYNNRGEAVLVPKDGGPAMPIFNQDGTPLTKQANESGNVQTAFRLAPDGITEIQVERDENGQWKDSSTPQGGAVIHGRVGRIDPVTGAPTSTLITDNRITTQQNQENARKRQSYLGEAKEWGGKETTFRRNKATEDSEIQRKTERLSALYQEQAGGTILNRGGRTKQEIETDKARLTKELETHRTNAAHFQTQADNAASKGTEARRNAELYSDSGGQGQYQPNGVIGRAPARDGKHHYTTAEIRTQAEASGVSYEQLYRVLKGNKKVVIGQ